MSEVLWGDVEGWLKKVVLDGDAKVEPGQGVSQHSKVDDVGVDGRHLNYGPSIDEWQVSEGDWSDYEQGFWIYMWFMDIYVSSVRVVEVILV